MIVEQFVEQALRDRASDIHLVQGLTPRYRVNGEIREMCSNCLTAEDCLTAAMELAGGDFRRAETVGEADLALTIADVRCRINLFRQRGGWSAAIRLLNDHIPDLDELGLPKAAAEFPAYGQGLVLISGETGSGKSTTLAAVLNRINHSERKHILTLEDPIEYVYTPDKCVINQREIRRDTASFAAGLRAALREDPDVILVGEMRDLETIETALTAAETGHLVFGTVHTNSAADSIDRIVDVFPAERQQQIRLQLSMTLRAVLSQQLLPKVGGGRVVCCEVMKVDGAIRNLIREGKTPQIVNAIQTTGNMGNILMDRALQSLLNAGTISKETWQAALRDPSQAGRNGPAQPAAGAGPAPGFRRI
ncbi:MAG: PilT/PilU family type 4a pilus ATPase [Oscillibacter sp.]|jgi:twitching motility protein PilT|nr:PilT/PilU family type 4a pilus ATPase [Oscillibacter sp.]